jgi:hypothetical protein
MKLAMLLALAGLSTAHAAEPTGTLTLVCEGVKETLIGSDVIGDRERVSMGLVVNFTKRTVEGIPGATPAALDAITETTADFTYSTRSEDGMVQPRGSGHIDRMTGDLWARFYEVSKLSVEYSLKCKPTQRMF